MAETLLQKIDIYLYHPDSLTNLGADIEIYKTYDCTGKRNLRKFQVLKETLKTSDKIRWLHIDPMSLFEEKDDDCVVNEELFPVEWMIAMEKTMRRNRTNYAMTTAVLCANGALNNMLWLTIADHLYHLTSRDETTDERSML